MKGERVSIVDPLTGELRVGMAHPETKQIKLSDGRILSQDHYPGPGGGFLNFVGRMAANIIESLQNG